MASFLPRLAVGSHLSAGCHCGNCRHAGCIRIPCGHDECPCAPFHRGEDEAPHECIPVPVDEANSV